MVLVVQIAKVGLELMIMSSTIISFILGLSVGGLTVFSIMACIIIEKDDNNDSKRINK